LETVTAGYCKAIGWRYWFFGLFCQNKFSGFCQRQSVFLMVMDQPNLPLAGEQLLGRIRRTDSVRTDARFRRRRAAARTLT